MKIKSQRTNSNHSFKMFHQDACSNLYFFTVFFFFFKISGCALSLRKITIKITLSFNLSSRMTQIYNKLQIKLKPKNASQTQISTNSKMLIRME